MVPYFRLMWGTHNRASIFNRFLAASSLGTTVLQGAWLLRVRLRLNSVRNLTFWINSCIFVQSIHIIHWIYSPYIISSSPLKSFILDLSDLLILRWDSLRIQIRPSCAVTCQWFHTSRSTTGSSSSNSWKLRMLRMVGRSEEWMVEQCTEPLSIWLWIWNRTWWRYRWSSWRFR